ncbi:MAG: hypothetical protein ACOYJF_11705 [Prevotella sp.]|jgi:hypothetical protein
MIKKYVLWLGMLLPLLGVLFSCSEEDIVFDHERPGFELRADRILFETILPSNTAADDDVYIVGAFNGLDDKSVIGNETFKLKHSDTIPEKYGIYLDPTTFVDGKTLEDGYHFVSAAQRNEVTAIGDTVVRTENPAVGTRTTLYVSKWAAYFDEAPAEPVHDGYVVYVDNQTSWGDALALYMWGDVNNLNGDWPGMQPTGQQVVDGVTYTYFDMGEANTGLNENLIFNNNGGGTQLADFAYTIDHDVFLRITDSKVEEISDTQPETAKDDGFKLYIENQTGIDSPYFYVWGDSELFGTWPGKQADGKETIDGVDYLYWNIGDDGSEFHPILNDNNGKQLDYSDVVSAAKDYYFKVTVDGWSLLK